jgi:tRNA (cytidine32/guanosine34-2'-O)-methyltransferase
MLITTHVLAPAGNFVAKIFRGRNIGFLYSQLRLLFAQVSVAKPSSSRNLSMESFVVCQNFMGGKYLNLPLDTGGYINVNKLTQCTESGDDGKDDDDEDNDRMDQYVVPFIACGDLSGFRPADWDGDYILDSDKSYPIQSAIAPIAPPINPPYQTSMEIEKQQHGNTK